MPADIRSLANALQRFSLGIPMPCAQSSVQDTLELKRTKPTVNTPALQLPDTTLRRTPPPVPPRDDIARFCGRWGFSDADKADVRCRLEGFLPARRSRLIFACDRLRGRLCKPAGRAEALRTLSGVAEYQLNALMTHVCEVFDSVPEGDMQRLSMLGSLAATPTLEREQIMRMVRAGLLFKADGSEAQDVLHVLSTVPQLELEKLVTMCESLGARGSSDMRMVCMLPVEMRTEAFALVRARAQRARLVQKGITSLEQLVNLSVQPHIVLQRTQAFINNVRIHPPAVQVRIDGRDTEGNTLRRRANLCVHQLRAISTNAAADPTRRQTARVFALAWFAAEIHADSYNVRLALMSLLGNPPDIDESDLCTAILMLLNVPYPQLHLQSLAMHLASSAI